MADAPSPGLVVGRIGALDHVSLDAPERRNALSIAMLDAIRDVAHRSANDERSRGLVLDHTGDVFSAGVDLVERRELPPGARNHSQALADLYRALWAYPKPLLCRVDGAVRGGGLGLVVAADVVVAGSRATFAFTEVRVGVAPALVGALAMARSGASRLAPWLLSGRTLDAARAAEVGLVTELVDDDGAAVVADWCSSIEQAAPRAQQVTKALTRRLVAIDVPALLEEMEVLSAEMFDGPEAREGMAAFAERRPPSWA
ncbi:MAG: enoyl-CoA hydratase-related protein [Ilumatobacteraceae bacterium]